MNDAVTIDPTQAPVAVQAWLERCRPLVERELERRLAPGSPDPGQLREAMRYAATGPGKRLRPALVIAACEAVGGQVTDALAAAAAVEMLHAYTLVHDDLPAMDDDELRRGRPTVHVVFGEAIAILAGDGLLTQALGTLAELGPRAGDAVAVLAARAGGRELLAGQAHDLALEARLGAGGARPDLAELEAVHAAKTGALFAAATELGAIAGGSDAATRAALARYGMAIGVAFQHADDRDDGEFPEHATAAGARMRALCDEAAAIARRLGPTGATLEAVAVWMGSRA